MFKEVKKINTCKANQSNDIPIKILKQNADICSEYIYNFL